GGKGVASFLGIVLALYWPLGLLLCAVWLVVAKLSKYSSLAALIAVGLSPVLALVIGHGQVFVLCSLMAALVYWRHRGNIAQLRQGTETKIGAKS
ncbi:MAG: glycerol-3-phosphate acyltransferase, partial [Rhodobacteraceae bacterium]|nr:glycerol-3-phosphate acyltransferase [Paracoccaceae bacterium]